jgi:signal transduction histidine kinase
LGLLLNDDIVKAHRGEVILDTAVGKDSVFTIILPL